MSSQHTTGGIFITFEGPDASGKTTQIGMLEQYLKEAEIGCVLTREPGGTGIGDQIRNILLDRKNESILPVTEALLYAASRAQLTGEVIRPALQRGCVVISDRFLDSSIAYQGFGRGLGDIVRAVNEPAVNGIRPDLTFLLKTEPSVMRRRRTASEEDRMDAQKEAFHREVLRGYLQLAEKEPERIRVIDGEQPPDTIAAEIRRCVEEILARWAERLPAEREYGKKTEKCEISQRTESSESRE